MKNNIELSAELLSKLLPALPVDDKAISFPVKGVGKVKVGLEGFKIDKSTISLPVVLGELGAFEASFSLQNGLRLSLEETGTPIRKTAK